MSGRAAFFWGVLGAAGVAGSVKPYISAEAGWTDYQPRELNLFLSHIESQFDFANPGSASQFNGSPQIRTGLGLSMGRVSLSVEAQTWRDRYLIENLGFDLASPGNAGLSCAQLEALGPGNSRGCVHSDVRMAFIPVMLCWEYSFWERKPFFGKISMGTGFVFGSADFDFHVLYYDGQDTREDLSFALDPGLAFQYQLEGSLEWAIRWGATLGIYTGYRFLRYPDFKLGNKKGHSALFDSIFNFPAEGDGFYFERFGNLPPEILIGGSEDKAITSTLEPVEGDFGGWYAGVKVLYYWGK